MQSYQRITYSELLKDRRVIFALMSACVAMIFMFFFDSILSDHIVNDLHKETDIGYFFGLICLAYAISAPAVTLICRFVKRRYVSLVSFLIATIGLLCFGPSKMLDLPENSIPLTVAGLVLLGMGASAIFVPLLAEIIDAIQVKYCVGNSPLVFDKASQMFNIAYSIGCIIAPIMGGLLNGYFGFQRTCDTMAMGSLMFGLIYLILNVIPSCIQERPKKVSIISKPAPRNYLSPTYPEELNEVDSPRKR